MRPMFSPSLMCMDLTKFDRQVEALNRRAAFYHVDIMDGHYVKNITLSPFFITQLKKIARIPIDAHLMCEAPEDIVPLCLEAGADTISFHPETAGNKIFRLIRQIKGQGRKVGVVLNPSEPVEILSQYLHLLDRITVLSVDPGFAGETFIAETLEKIKQLKKMRKKNIIATCWKSTVPATKKLSRPLRHPASISLSSAHRAYSAWTRTSSARGTR